MKLFVTVLADFRMVFWRGFSAVCVTFDVVAF
jgi:hypothetical protein